jgi:hypothetical protein
MSKSTEKWTLSKVQRMIKNKIKEDSYLDYKASEALLAQDGGKLLKEFSKDVSAFANSGGGVIIYGVVEEGHLPIKIDNGFDPAQMTRESLDQMISSTIHPNIEDVRVHQIETDKGNRVFYVIEIPQSDRAPHQAHDKRFYARRNFISEPMEEYEIRDVLMRNKAPNVTLDFYFRRNGARIEQFPLSLVDLEILHGVEINASLTNDGGGEVQYAAIRLLFDARLSIERIGVDKITPMTMMFDGIKEYVARVDINWGGPEKMPLFRSVNYLLLDEDISIKFKAPWLQEKNSPFILWDIRAPGMEPNQGFVRLRLDGNYLVLSREKVPEISDIQQDGWNRDFLKNPDLSFHPKINK